MGLWKPKKNHNLQDYVMDLGGYENCGTVPFYTATLCVMTGRRLTKPGSRSSYLKKCSILTSLAIVVKV